MAVQSSDTLEGTSLTIGSDGIEHTRKFLVTDLTGDAVDRLYQATLHFGIPQRGELHPSIPFLVCDTISADPAESGEAAHVTAVYRQANLVAPDVDPQGNDEAGPIFGIRVSSSVQEVETEFDVNGQQITVEHTFTREDGTEETVIAPVRVAYRVAMTTVGFFRREQASPGDKSKAFVGTVNSMQTFTDPPRFWMCTKIDGNSRDGGKSYDVEYEFQRSVANINNLLPGFGTWDPIVSFHNEDGSIPLGLEAGKGWKQTKVLPEMDFRRLKLGIAG